MPIPTNGANTTIPQNKGVILTQKYTLDTYNAFIITFTIPPINPQIPPPLPLYQPRTQNPNISHIYHINIILINFYNIKHTYHKHPTILKNTTYIVVLLTLILLSRDIQTNPGPFIQIFNNLPKEYTQRQN